VVVVAVEKTAVESRMVVGVIVLRFVVVVAPLTGVVAVAVVVVAVVVVVVVVVAVVVAVAARLAGTSTWGF
jgi:hypothetical protein